MSRFMHERYINLQAYVPGEQPQDKRYVKLNTNELPFAPSPKVLNALSRTDIEDLRLYPDPQCIQLRDKLAAVYGVRRENVFITNGSDDILNFAFMAYGQDGAAFADITYGFYEVYAQFLGVDYQTIPLEKDFTISPNAYVGLNRFIALANPNAPTGIALSVAEIEKIVAGNTNHVVLVDEAYVDFGAESCAKLINKYPNLLVVMTYSKYRAMAGARLGFALAQEDIIADLEKLKYAANPYAINRLTLKCAEAALDSQEYYENCAKQIIKTREYTKEALEALGFSVLPSAANFLFAAKECVGGAYLYEQLKARGVLVRNFTQPRIAQYNRITIGTMEQMDILLDAIRDILHEGGKGA